jgi:APA family basic amino acid/polyamine antiporter
MPKLGILITGIFILSLVIFGTFDFIVRSATFTILLYYSITNIAALKQPKNERIYSWIILVFGLIGCLAMSLSLPFNIIISGAGMLVIGFIVREIFHKIYGPKN